MRRAQLLYKVEFFPENFSLRIDVGHNLRGVGVKDQYFANVGILPERLVPDDPVGFGS